jgi:hypothetical protein
MRNNSILAKFKIRVMKLAEILTLVSLAQDDNTDRRMKFHFVLSNCD